MTKEEFIADEERICEDFAFDRIDHEMAMNRLSRLGFDAHEAEALLVTAIA